MQLVVHLLLLKLQLLLVGQVLPLATAANAEMLAERSRAYITIFYNTYNLALCKRMFLAAYLHVNNVARHAPGHKNYQFVPVEQAFPLGSHGFDGDALKYR